MSAENREAPVAMGEAAGQSVLRRHGERIIATALFAILLMLGYLWIQTSVEGRVQEQRQRTRDVATVQASVFELNLMRSISAAKILGSYVEIQNGDIRDFEHHAEMIYASLGGITNLQMAPDGIVRRIFPLQGHERALGHNLLKDDERRKEADLAIRSRQMTLAGPFKLVQGGVAIVARNPVFLPVDSPHLSAENSGRLAYARQGDEQFWGYASVLIYFDQVLAMTELSRLSERDFAYRLWRRHPDSGQFNLLAGEDRLPVERVVTREIHLPNSNWYLDVAAVSPAVAASDYGMYWGLNVAFALLLSGWCYALLMRPKQLALKVAERTRELNCAQQELARLQRDNELILNSAAEGIFGIDLQGHITFMNPAALAMLEYDPETLVGRAGYEVLLRGHPDATKCYSEVNPIQQSCEEGVVKHAQGEVFWKATGKSFPVEYVSAPIRERGKTLGAVVVFRDISERERAERELRLAACSFESHEAISITDSGGTILRVNKAFTRITGYAAQEVIGKTNRIHHSGLQDSRHYEQMWQQLLCTGHWEGEIWNRRKNGETYPAWLGISAVKNKDGEVTHYVGHFIDITKRKRAENELSAEKERAEAANRAKAEFLAVMSHEIRTPLSGVLGLLDLLRDSKLNAKQIELVETAQGSGEALMTVINDVLDFSKMEAGKLKLETSSIAPQPLLSSVNLLLGPRARSKGLALTVEQHGELPAAFLGDPGRLRQVLLNLVSNAIKFTEEGNVTLSLHSRRQGGDRFLFAFEVKDSGIGIADADQRRLFDRFNTVDASFSRRYGGTGLGLSICRQLVELMGGRIGVESRLGEGSRFWFEIEVTEQARPAGAEPPPQKRPHGQTRRSARILVAEDVVANRLVAKEMLERAGHRVQLVENGIEAIQALNLGAFDLVLMDISMPEMDGLQATAAIRRLDSAQAQVPIIAMTAHALRGEKERCLETGMNDYLTKPIQRDRLLETIDRWILVPQSTCTDKVQVELEESGCAGAVDVAKGLTSDAEADAGVTSQTEMLVNDAVLRQIGEDTDESLVPELVGVFVGDARKRLQRLEEAQQNAAWDVVQLEAHSLASSALAFGLPTLHALAKVLEQACIERDLNAAQATAADLVTQGPGLLSALERHIERWPSSAAPE